MRVLKQPHEKVQMARDKDHAAIHVNESSGMNHPPSLVESSDNCNPSSHFDDSLMRDLKLEPPGLEAPKSVTHRNSVR